MVLLRFSIRHPRLIVGLAALLTLLSCLAIPQIQLRLDARALIPQGDPKMRESDAASGIFGLNDMVVIGIDGGQEGIFRPENLKLLQELSRDLARTEGILPESVISLATVPRLNLEGDSLDLRPLLDRGEVADAAMAQRLRRETSQVGLDDGVLVTRDARAAAIYAEVDRAADRSHIGSRILALVSRYRDRGLPLYVSGNVMAQAVLGETSARDLAWLVPVVIVVLVAVMSLVFAHPIPALASLLEVGVSLFWTMGLMGLRGESVFVTTLTLPVVLIVIGVTDDAYALNRFCVEARRHPDRPIAETVLVAFSFVSPALRVTAAATIGGLLSLAAVKLEPQRVFGLYGALSVFFSTLFTFTLLPALLVLIKPRLRSGDSRFTRIAEGSLRALVIALGRGWAWKVLAAVALLALPAGLLAASRLRIEDSWVGNLPDASEIVRGDREINRLLAGTNTLDLLFDSGVRDGFLDPGRLSALGVIEDRLASSPMVGATVSPYGDVVRVCAALAGVDYRAYREQLRRGERSLTRPEIEQAVMMLASVSRAPSAQRLDEEGRRSHLTVFIRAGNYSRVRDVLALASRPESPVIGSRPVPFGDGWISYLTVHSLVLGEVRSIVLAIAFDLLLTLVVFRSLGASLMSVLPVAVSVLLVLGTLAAMDIPLGTANSMFACIALGIGIDYAINVVAQYRVNLRRGEPRYAALLKAYIMTGPAVITSAIAIISGFMVLALSSVPPNRVLGILVCFAMALCAGLTLLLVPSCVLLRKENV